jgi:hypothetical protein
MLIEVLDLGGARDRGWGCLADRRRESDCTVDRVRGREAGMDEHLIKPVAPESLKSVLLSIGKR